MQSFFDKIEKLKCGWNHVPMDEAAFHALCKKQKIKVKHMPLSVEGFYNCAKGKHHIAIKTGMRPFRESFVMFHEFAHYLMHSPSTDATESYCGSKTHSRDEQEADAFAYCALLPLQLLKTRDPEELADMYGISFFLERLAVYERYGI